MNNQYKNELDKLTNLLHEDVLSALAENNAIIAGGCITSIFCNRDINDIDVYFRNPKDFISCLRMLNNDGIAFIHQTDKSVTLKKGWGDEENLLQLIHGNFYEEIEDVFKAFDFSICMGAFDTSSEAFVFHPDFFKHNSQRYLSYNVGTLYPLISMLRIDKYREKGYTISKSEFLRALLNCLSLEIKDWKQLKEHVGGMYGWNMDSVFPEEEEFSLEKAIDILSTLTSVREKSEGNLVKVNSRDFIKELKKKYFPEQKTRYFKNVKPDTLTSWYRTTDAITYKEKTIVNGGTGGIYYFDGEAILNNLLDSGYNENKIESVIVELHPFLNNEYTGVKITEIGPQVMIGDVFVGKAYTHEEIRKELI